MHLLLPTGKIAVLEDDTSEKSRTVSQYGI